MDNEFDMAYTRVNLTLPDDIFEKLKGMSEKEFRSISKQVAFLVNFYEKHSQDK